MASNKMYTLKLVIDPQQLAFIAGGTRSRSQGRKKSEEEKRQEKTRRFLGKLLGGGSMLKTIAKLSLVTLGIFTFVKGLWGLAKQSSPVLQTMLKLFNTSIMFIFRPIGDFLGFFLRPLVIYFLRQIALPFYRTWVTFARDAGKWFGESLVPLLNLFKGGLQATGILPADPPAGKDAPHWAQIADTLDTTPVEKRDAALEWWKDYIDNLKLPGGQAFAEEEQKKPRRNSMMSDALKGLTPGKFGPGTDVYQKVFGVKDTKIYAPEGFKAPYPAGNDPLAGLGDAAAGISQWLGDALSPITDTLGGMLSSLFGAPDKQQTADGGTRQVFDLNFMRDGVPIGSAQLDPWGSHKLDIPVDLLEHDQ